MKKRMQRILIGAACFAAAILLENLAPGLPWYVLLAAFLVSYVIIGGDVVKRAVSNIGKGQVFDENFLMTIATVGAFFVGDYKEAVTVMLFYQVGELFQTYAVNRSRKNITELMDIRPDFANVRRNGVEEEVDPDEVAVGELIVVKPGERIPLDGVIVKGNSSLDTMALTGESVPREVLCGEEVISGCINLTGVLEVEVSKPFGESTVSKILDLVENASSKKAEAENFITKFARYYTPIVVICAAALAVIPPLFLGGWSDWIYRGLTFLVVSCPCAVVISVPLSFFGGLGGASKAGVLVKGSNYLEALAETEIVVMDKTGTLTKGTFKVKEVQPAMEESREVISKEELLEITAYAESYSNHPISLSIQKEYGKELDKSRLESTQELAGHGVHAVIDGADIYAGNEKLMLQQKISFTHAAQIGTIVHVARDNQYLGYILIADEVKDDAAACISGLKAEGVKRIVMLTGDRRETAEYVASQIGLTEVHSGLLPGDKVDEVEKLIQSKSPKGKLVFVGDGINDAPVLARADIGIAMGGLGSDAAIEAADVVIMTDEPSRIATAMKISRKTLGIVKQNIVFALGVKILVLILAAIGMANMWLAVFADVGVAVLAILNAMRALQGIPCKQGKGID
ncbi:cadmium-translocating P-type ATPase [Lachnospiraceae bacterium OM02-31]|nr:cadmium-translocating P-type ATPase [Lachnospiraceae bacterium OM02-31]RJW57197.1 cadmium-translocating P-type ATPase [Lachnospiraceae bacterium OM02-3]